MERSEYFPNPEEEPLIKAFCNKFGGGFGAHIFGSVHYEDKNNKRFYTPKTKTEFFNMVSQSLKQDKNLFLDRPIPKTPKGRLE